MAVTAAVDDDFMKNYKNRGTIHLLATPLVMFLLLVSSFSSNAQSVRRQAISSLGNTSHVPGALIRQTAGQCFSTGPADQPSPVLQGFQQPILYIAWNNSAEPMPSIRIYPVPATDRFTIESDSPVENSRIAVTDLTGQEIYSVTNSELNVHTIDCSLWVSGMYFINVSDAKNNSKSIKLIITK